LCNFIRASPSPRVVKFFHCCPFPPFCFFFAVQDPPPPPPPPHHIPFPPGLPSFSGGLRVRFTGVFLSALLKFNFGTFPPSTSAHRGSFSSVVAGFPFPGPLACPAQVRSPLIFLFFITLPRYRAVTLGRSDFPALDFVKVRKFSFSPFPPAMFPPFWVPSAGLFECQPP